MDGETEVTEVPTIETQETSVAPDDTLLSMLQDLEREEEGDSTPEPVAASESSDEPPPPTEASDNAEPELATLAQQYGVDVETLSRFESPKDAKVFLELRDREFFALGQQATQGYEQQQPQQPQVPPQPQEPQPDSLVKKFEQLGFDDEAAKALAEMESKVQRYESWLEQQNAAAQAAMEAQQQELLNQYEKALEKVDPDRYGVTGKETPSQRLAREENKRNASIFIAGIQQKGVAAPLDMESLAQRSDAIAFYADNQKKAALALQAQVKERASKRLGSPGGTRRPVADTHVPGLPFDKQPGLLQALADAAV